MVSCLKREVLNVKIGVVFHQVFWVEAFRLLLLLLSVMRLSCTCSVSLCRLGKEDGKKDERKGDRRKGEFQKYFSGWELPRFLCISERVAPHLTLNDSSRMHACVCLKFLSPFFICVNMFHTIQKCLQSNVYRDCMEKSKSL